MVNTFANWCPEGTYVVVINPLSNFSLMKCRCIKICLVLSCWTRLWAILIVNLLSRNNFMEPSYLMFKSSRTIFICNTSHIPWAIARNSPSALDRATFCFLLLHVTRFPPKKYVIPWCGSPTSYWSCIVCIKVRLPPHLNKSSLPIIPLRNWSIQFTVNVCSSLGSCMNWLTTLTAYARSGLVWAKYISFPLSLWY